MPALSFAAFDCFPNNVISSLTIDRDLGAFIRSDQRISSGVCQFSGALDPEANQFAIVRPRRNQAPRSKLIGRRSNRIFVFSRALFNLVGEQTVRIAPCMFI